MALKVILRYKSEDLIRKLVSKTWNRPACIALWLKRHNMLFISWLSLQWKWFKQLVWLFWASQRTLCFHVAISRRGYIPPVSSEVLGYVPLFNNSAAFHSFSAFRLHSESLPFMLPFPLLRPAAVRACSKTCWLHNLWISWVLPTIALNKMNE